MSLKLTHNRFGDYTPLHLGPAAKEGNVKEGRPHYLIDLAEFEDRPHFGVNEPRTILRFPNGNLERRLRVT